MDAITKLSNAYNWSQDYKCLAELMKKDSIVCKIRYSSKYPSLYDIAHTIYNGLSGEYSISSRGRCYVISNEEDKFIEFCKHYDVSFIGVKNG